MGGKDMSDLEKVRVLLPHWLEHNKSHAGEFSDWAELVRKGGNSEVAALLDEAVRQLQAVDNVLAEALERAGGPIDDRGLRHHHPE